jgi:hypothetical protein
MEGAYGDVRALFWLFTLSPGKREEPEKWGLARLGFFSGKYLAPPQNSWVDSS